MALRGSIDGDVTQPIRRVEDVEYWRKRAGWFDDDASMKDYNRGVYDSYFSIDDDDSSGGYSGNKKELLKSVAQFVGVFIALAFLILIIRSVTGAGTEKSTTREARISSRRSKSKSRSESRSGRSGRSKSRSRRSSRSRSRARSSGDYELMDDKSSKSRSSRSRSRSKVRSSRSKSRSRQEPQQQEMLV
mmetsp:Transcript_3557/g.4944  ORF Transcript_3557/g.4944 Transcript_3557/m.4944 type:complete len:189 (+) Transcript_3557:184-750(+)